MPSPDRALQRHVESIGRAPGSVVVPEGAAPPKITVLIYDREHFEVRRDVSVEALTDLGPEGSNAWVDVSGLGDEKVLVRLIELFDIPWLAMEDVLHSPQRPKAESYGDARFIVMRTLDRPGTCDMDQCSIFVRGHVVLTFQERHGDPFDGLRHRLEDKDSQLRQRGPDYLVYRLIDSCVDSIFPAMQRLSDTVERIEDVAIEQPSARLIRDLHSLRRDLRLLERHALATRDAIVVLVRDEDGFFDHATRPYLRDVHDHASQVVELSHYYTSVANDIGQFIIGTLDMKMNQVMRILAAVTVVLMPPTLIAGIFGMNFAKIPGAGSAEDAGYWGFGIMCASLAVMSVVLAFWMRRIGWLRSDAG